MKKENRRVKSSKKLVENRIESINKSLPKSALHPHLENFIQFWLIDLQKDMVKLEKIQSNKIIWKQNISYIYIKSWTPQRKWKGNNYWLFLTMQELKDIKWNDQVAG